MTFNIRTHLATAGLKIMLEGAFSALCELTDPDGVETKVNEVGDPLRGELLLDREDIDPESGDLVTVKETMLSLRKTALPRIPVAGETWKVAVALDASTPTVLTTHLANADESPTGGSTIGFIKLFLKDVEQS